MKIIQVTDLHLVAPGERLHGLDPLGRLDAALADIAAHHGDAALVVFSGDLADAGAPAAYEALRDRLARFPVPVRLMLGNHDDRAAFRAVFPEVPVEHGFVQTVVDTGEGRLILLDTLDQGAVPGRLCDDRLAWLDARLAEAAGRPVYIFLHHPPFRLHMPVLDAVRLLDDQAFLAACRRHGDIRHVFAGHVHRPVTGSWQGLTFSALRGTNHQSSFDFTTGQGATIEEPPAYAVILIDAAGVVVHFHDFPVRLDATAVAGDPLPA